MPLFIISWRDNPGALPVRMATREAHLAYLAANPGVVKLGGPYLTDAGEMAGSMLVVEADSLEAARAFHEADPYKASGLFDASEVTPWRLTVGALG